MRIGIFILPAPGTNVFQVLQQIEQAEQQGLAAAWLANVASSLDALTVLALAGQRTERIELGTFVVPTYPRHPSALAQQALTTQAFADGRLTLGIGLSHRAVMEGVLGFDWDHPIRHTREYLNCLTQLLAQEPAQFEGEEFTVRGLRIAVQSALPPQVLVAALGPQMLRLTGRMADGTAIWMGGSRYIAEHVVPMITQAAEDAGRPAPRIVAGLPVCVTDRADDARSQAAESYARYGQLPSYRNILDKEGASGPADVALIGNAAEVQSALQSLADAGVTDFAAAIFSPTGEDPQATIQVLCEFVSNTT